MKLLLPRLLIFIPLLFPCISSIFGPVHVEISEAIVVDKSGNGPFNSIQAAIDSIPSNNDRWIHIQLSPGTYEEKVEIPVDKPYIILQGESRETTKITYNGHERTDLSATFTSRAENVVAIGITFEMMTIAEFNHRFENGTKILQNFFNLAQEGIFDTGKKHFITQALAARIYGDKSAFYGCGFKGVQDTLWDVSGRHYYRNCYIEGAIDFIFGSGQSIFEDCDVYANVGLVPQINEGYMTAQGRSTEDETNGFVFINGSVNGSGPVLLGRAYGPFSRVIFYKTLMGSIVSPRGWNEWNFPGREYNFMYAELDCEGPGSSTTDRVPWEKKLDEDQMQDYLLSSFINQDGWVVQIPVFQLHSSTSKS